MMKFDIASSQVSTTRIRAQAEKAKGYGEHLSRVARSGTYDSLECSLVLPADREMLEKSVRLARVMSSPRLRAIIVIGIGGSNLGTKALYDALWGYKDVLEPQRTPKMFFAETVDQEYLSTLDGMLHSKKLKKDEVLIVVISKSGTTSETVALADYLDIPLLRTVIITDEGSALWNLARKNGIQHLPIPKKVGGRYSVFSPVGIFPLAALGYDVTGLLKGAAEMRTRCLSSDVKKNPALAGAAVLSLHMQSGAHIHDTFLFHPELESLGKWYRQLLGESIGKERDTSGTVVHIGLTPTVSLGSTDLHSVGQLYLGGPKDRVTSFVTSELSDKGHKKIRGLFSRACVPDTLGKTIPQIMDAIFQGVTRAYRKKQLPFMTATLSDLSPESLGGWMQYKMIETMMLGNLLGVNAFDQPNVEAYKVETKKILKRKRKRG